MRVRIAAWTALRDSPVASDWEGFALIRSVKFASVPVTDQNRSLEIFTRRLGFSVYTDQPFPEGQRRVELEIPGSETRVVLFTPDAHRGWIGGFSNISFACDDVERTYAELRERGVEFVAPPEQEHWGACALFKDPDGTTFCLSGRQTRGLAAPGGRDAADAVERGAPCRTWVRTFSKR